MGFFANFFKMGFLGRFAFWFVVSVFIFGHINIFDRNAGAAYVVVPADETGIRLVWSPGNLIYIVLLSLILSISGLFFKS